MVENQIFDDLRVGDRAEAVHLCTNDDLVIFANASGSHNPLNLPAVDGDGDGVPDAIAPGMLVASLMSAVLGNQLPGPGTLYRAQTLEFHERAHAGDELRSIVVVTAKNPDGTVELDTTVRRTSDEALIMTGRALVIAPRHKMRFDDHAIPGLTVRSHPHFEALLARAESLPELATVVVCPEDASSLGGALLAARHTLIRPILLGNRDKIMAVADELGEDISGVELIHVPRPRLSAEAAVALVNEGRAEAVMKGHLHTDDLLRPALDRQTGLRMGRRFTHIFVMDVPGLPHPLLVSDAAINIAPDLPTKVDICQNAIDLAISIGIAEPKVGVLSAVETVNPDIPSSMDAALLSKMAERGQITGGVVDGPLAMDNAIDLAAARAKGIRSRVAGRAEVLVVPGIDAGNMLAKQLAYISHAEGAGLVLGAKVPVILNSRSDSAMARLASAAVAAIHHNRVKGAAK